MKKKIIFVKALIFTSVILLSYFLRNFNYANIPLPGQSMDEYSYSWVGLSLIELGMPVGISGINGYKNSDLRYINVDRVFQETAKGNPLSVDKPWFDHPPLMGLLTGGFAYLKGARVFEDTVAVFIRKPMVYLGTISVALLGYWMIINFGFTSGIISMLIYGTMPIAVVSSRMIQAENGLIPLMLLTMIFLSKYLKSRQWLWLWATGFTTGVGTLFKLSGVSNILMVTIILWISNYRNKWKEIIFFLTTSLSVTTLFFIYGLAYDWGTFVAILKSNSNRFYGIGPVALYELMTQVKLTHNKYLTDFWPLLAWIGYWGLITNRKKQTGETMLMIGTTSYLAIYIFMGSQSFGWYAFPFWPLLTMSLSLIMTKLWNNGQVLTLWLWLLVPIGGTIGKIIDINKFQEYSGVWRFGLVIIILTLLVSQIKEESKYLRFLSKTLVIIAFLLAIYLNTKYIGMFNLDYWYKM